MELILKIFILHLKQNKTGTDNHAAVIDYETPSNTFRKL